jgi:hypothetical protein
VPIGGGKIMKKYGIKEPATLLFSIQREEFDLEFFCTGGKGGQNQNKRKMGVRVKHRPSGAVGESREERSQLQNKKIAFERMANTEEFKKWHKIECSRKLGNLVDINKMVDEWMNDTNIKIEVKQDGKWVEVPLESIMIDEPDEIMLVQKIN